MARKQVTSLYQLSIRIVNDQVKESSYKHCLTCDNCTERGSPERCSSFNAMREMFQVPPNILQDIYDEQFTRCQKFGPATNYRTLYFLSALLYYPDLQISDYQYDFSDFRYCLPFMETFGKCVKSISFDRLVSCFDCESKSVWEMFCINSCNVVTIDFYGIRLSDVILGVIGKKCHKLKELKNFLVPRFLTDEAIERLCFADFPDNRIRNECCDTIQSIEITFQTKSNVVKYTGDRKWGIITALLTHLSNLKTFGHEFYVDLYLRTVVEDSVQETSLEVVRISDLSKDIIPLLKKFCPKLKNMVVDKTENGITKYLDSFQLLNQLECFDDFVREKPLSYEDLVTVKWFALKELRITFSCSIDISVFAEQLPSLEKLLVSTTQQFLWDGNKYFKSLKDASFMVNVYENISWFASFAHTIKILTLRHVGHDNLHSCVLNDMLRIPFPLLEEFRPGRLLPDFEFITSFINWCLNLRYIMVMHYNYPFIEEMSEYLKENNLNCTVEGTSH